MDRHKRKSTSAWALMGGAAVGAVGVYFVYKHYCKKDLGDQLKELQMSVVPEQDGDAGQEASQQSRTQEEKPEATESTSLPGANHTPHDISAVEVNAAGASEYTGTEHQPPQGAALSWHQTSEEVTLEACCPRDLRARDVVCSFTTHSLHVEARGMVIADGELFAPIAPDDCWWEFGDTGNRSQKQDNKRLIIDMVKAPLPSSRCMWESLYAGGDARRAVQAS